MSYKTLGQTLVRGSRKADFWRALCAPTDTEIATRFGWLLLDMEHSPNDLSQITDRLPTMTVGGEGVEMTVHPPVADQTMRPLVIGVRDLMFPMIQTAYDAALRYLDHGFEFVAMAGDTGLWTRHMNTMATKMKPA